MTDKNSNLVTQWKQLVEATSVEDINVGELNSNMDRYIAACMLENTHNDIKRNVRDYLEAGVLKQDAPHNTHDAVEGIEKVILPIVRRKAAKMAAKDIMGVQPMPTANSVVFAMRNYRKDSNGTNDEEVGTGYPNHTFAGVKSDNTAGHDLPPLTTDMELDPFATGGYTIGGPGATSFFEGDIDAAMTLKLDRVNVTAKSMALRTSYSHEARDDLRNYHGLDMENEVNTMMGDELTREVDTFLIRVMKFVAKPGAVGTAAPGTFDLNADTDGRHRQEKVQQLAEFISNEGNFIFADTLRGHGNKVVASPKVAMALAAYEWTNINNGTFTLDDDAIGAIKHIGKIHGTIDLYVDPFTMLADHFVIGYHGGPTDSGLYYCPYVPLSVHKAVDPKSLNPIVGFKSRFGVVQNPFVVDANGQPLGESLTADTNPYYRIVKVVNI